MKQYLNILTSSAWFLVLSMGLFSCNDGNYSEAKITVEAYREELNEYKAEFAQIDTTELNSIAKEISYAMDSLESMAVDNKWILEKEEAEFLANYKSLIVPAEKLSGKAEILSTDLLYSEKQLANLQSDIQNRALPADSVFTYLNQEKKALSILEKSTQNMIEGHKVLKARYDLLHPQYKYYVNRISSRK